VIIHSHYKKKKERKERKRLKGKRFWRTIFIISISINAFFLLGMLIGGSVGIRKSLKNTKNIESLEKTIDKFKRQVKGATLRVKSVFVSSVPAIEIDIKFKDYKKIISKREEILKVGLNFSDKTDFVPATIKHDGKSYPARIRLKGDNVDRLKTDKWPFRIKLQKGYAINGVRVFSLHHPEERNYAYEWAYLYNLRDEGILVPRYEFVRVIINGKDKGIYAFEENFSKELMESQGMREGIILKFNESPYWAQWSNWGYEQFDPALIPMSCYPEFFVLPPRKWLNVDIDTFQSTKIGRRDDLSIQRDVAIGLLESFRTGQKRASEVFDAKKIARYFAISHLWGGEHGLSWKDSRFYYNPITSKIEPVGYDSMSGPWTDSLPTSDFLAKGGFSKSFPWGAWDWAGLVLRDKEIAKLYVEEAFRITDPTYLINIKNKMQKNLSRQLKILWHEFTETIDWSIIENNREIYRRVLNPIQTIRTFVDPYAYYDDSSEVSYLKFEIKNLLTLPIEITGFQINNSKIDLSKIKSGKITDKLIEKQIILDAQVPFISETSTFYIPIDKSLLQKEKIAVETSIIEVRNRILGGKKEYPSRVIFMPKPKFIKSIPSALSLEEFIKKFPFAQYDKNVNTIYIKKGTWVIYDDMLVPEGCRLKIAPGTVLKFKPKKLLITRGPVEIVGSDAEKIVLCADEDGWSGLVVLDKNGDSVLENVTIKDCTGAETDNWVLTGAVTFYNTNLYFNKVLIENMMCEDGVNLIHTKYLMSNSIFKNTSSDALDNDFCEGTIENTVFLDVKADGIDVSGTNLTVKDVKVFNAGDKGLSIGERSNVYAENILVEGADFGVASKDLSEVELNSISIKKTIFGIAAYQKKPEYGPAKINANNVKFEQVKKEILCQTGSSVIVGGKESPSEEVDIDKMYEKWKKEK